VGDELARRFLVVAGEASGDLHAARMITALALHGRIEVKGVAGPELRAAGVECLVRAEDLAMLGFAEIPAKLPRLFATRRRLLEQVRSWKPHAVVLVDYPGFNLRVGPELERLGATIFYYIAPQVWAWHPERAARMAQWVDRLAVVFPFEEPIFRQAGVDATYVGHPLLDDFGPERTESEFRAELGVGPDDRILGLLPGSRPQEIARHLPVLLEAARLLESTRPDLLTVVPLAPGLPDPSPGLPGPSRLRWLRGRTRSVQAHATACAVASGTATLETALFATPHVIVYRTGWLNYRIASRLVTLERIGLPNIVAEAPVVPELIQGRLTPDSLAETLAPWLDDPAARAAARTKLECVRARLGGPGASRRAAELLWSLTS
jgi:lipid-A-disaccharide synthase